MKKHYDEQVKQAMEKNTKLEKDITNAEKDKERLRKDLGMFSQVHEHNFIPVVI